MKKLLFLLPLCLLLANCSETTYNTLKVPKVERFTIEPNGDVVFYGSGMNAVKDFDVSFDFSIASHESLGKTQIVFIGKSIDIKDDTQFTIHAAAIEKAQVTPMDSTSFSKEFKSYIQASSGGKAAQNLAVADKELNKTLLSHIGTSKLDYALWLTLKDTGKKFWNPENKLETTFKFGFYQLSATQPGNFSNYSKVLEWDVNK